MDVHTSSGPPSAAQAREWVAAGWGVMECSCCIPDPESGTPAQPGIRGVLGNQHRNEVMAQSDGATLLGPQGGVKLPAALGPHEPCLLVGHIPGPSLPWGETCLCEAFSFQGENSETTGQAK